MSILALMRHAHAEMPSSGLKDFDRPLSKTGWNDAKHAAEQFLETGLAISKVFCSPARRTTETLQCVRETVPITGEITTYLPDLYSGKLNAYQELLKKCAQNDVAMIIGHNPMIEHFAFNLAQSGDEFGLTALKSGYPTAAIAVLDLGATPNDPAPSARLIHFITPDRH
jgi:phosphohistidine phosphatase